MKIKSLKIVYFSPTSTTKSVALSIMEGIDSENYEQIDITKPDSRKKPLTTTENDLLIVAVPVYMGRVPALIIEWINSIQGNNTPVIPVVVYGNRVYDDALLELKNILKNCGCIPIAAAAYIGEHSFSDDKVPVANGRPDAVDRKHAQKFGERITEKIKSVYSYSEIHIIDVPGCYPYRGDNNLWIVDFIEVNNNCNKCGICAENCPTGAIDKIYPKYVENSKCITCCACIKGCPINARVIKEGPVKEAQMRLHTLYSERKEPENYIW